MSAFFVTTNGQSASKWLAGRLNSHPAIVCSHSPAAPPLSLKQEEYTQQDMAQIHVEEAARKRVPLDVLIDELEALEPGARHHGNVHHFNLHQLQTNRAAHPPRRALVVVDLVRHPVDLVRSSTANMTRQATHNPARVDYLRAVRRRNLSLYEEVEKEHGLDADDIGTLAFMAACMTFWSLRKNLDVQDLHARVPMEVVTRDRVAFSGLVSTLTQGEVECDEAYLDQVFATGRTNVHQGRAPRDHASIYRGWLPWQRNLYDRMATSTGVEEAYSDLGYVFRFRG